jgi:D-alanyl-D-alanine carboxypeptidase/D-alanyl-D-alanine-endopeptidase (penicillin-binding protein 4)
MYIYIMKRLMLFMALLGAFAATGGAQTTKTPAKLALETEIAALKKDAGLKNAAWAVYVQNIATGAVEAEYNSQMSLLPASIQKTVTTSTALALLGSNFKFETKLQYTGTIDTANGILHGNLYFTGGGDPSLGSKRYGAATSIDSVFSQFIHALQKKRIRSIDGYLIADESIFDDLIPRSWGYEDVGNYYGCAVCGLNIFENQYRLYFDAGAAIGDSAKLVGMEPRIPEITFVNMVKTGKQGSGDQVFILGGPYTYLRLLDGTVPIGKKNFDVDGAIPDPSRYCLQLFSARLNDAGISVSKGSTLMREERWKAPLGLIDTLDRKNISTFYSPSLEKIIYQTNLKSVNLFAEVLLKMIGYKQSGIGSSAAGITAIENYWSSKGIDLKGFDIYDGSGLSRKNRLTAQQVGKILAGFFTHKEYPAYSASFPVAGKSGGMNSYLKGTIAENNLIAKTGTMDGVRSFAGYVKTASGQDLAFVIIMNNFTCSISEIRDKCESLMLKIAELD